MHTRVKVDEDLPREIAYMIRSAGHDACTVVEQKMTGSTDVHLMRVVRKERRCLITADKGFADPRKHPPGTHSGIVLFRLPRESRKGYVRLAKLLLASATLEELSGSITVVTPTGVRTHRG